MVYQSERDKIGGKSTAQMKHIVAAILLTAGVFSCVSANAAATSINTMRGLSISPAIEQISLAKGQDSVTFDSVITNNTPSATDIEEVTDDFTALNTSGSVAFLNTGNTALSPHGLAHWISTKYTEFALPPGGHQSVPITISGASSLAPGGHYGAVIYRVIPTPGLTKGHQVSTNEAVSLLVFLTTFNAGNQVVTLLPPQIPHVTLTMPNVINTLFSNTGNVQTIPRGIITIHGRQNTEIARGTINTDSGIVLPSTNRLYQVMLTPEKHLILPGRYTLSITYQAAGEKTSHTYTDSFYYVGQAATVVIISALAGTATFFAWRFRRKQLHYRIISRKK